MGRVVFDFISRVNPELIDGGLVKHEGYAWMDSLELRRCRDRATSGDLRFNKHRMTVEDFIGGHSMPMLLALIDKKVSDDDVLKSIRCFKWIRINDALRAKAKRPPPLFRFTLISVTPAIPEGMFVPQGKDTEDTNCIT
jgi:hypothetical protein